MIKLHVLIPIWTTTMSCRNKDQFYGLYRCLAVAANNVAALEVTSIATYPKYQSSHLVYIFHKDTGGNKEHIDRR